MHLPTGTNADEENEHGNDHERGNPVEWAEHRNQRLRRCESEVKGSVALRKKRGEKRRLLRTAAVIFRGR